jgi:L-2,4-diaminobutyrate decarboxylase
MTFRFFEAHVVRSRRLGPTIVRITFGGKQLESFAGGGRDQSFSLFLPHPGQSAPVVPTGAGDEWFTHWRAMDPTVRAIIRAYTVREQRRELSEVDVDFALHGTTGAGPASDWAGQARAGDRVIMLGPAIEDNKSVGFRPPAGTGWVLIAADETALPATAGILAWLPAGFRARVWIEVPHAEDIQDLPSEADAEVTWLVRGATPSPGLVVAAVRAAELPAGTPYAWVAGESGAVKALRRHLVGERGFDRKSVTFSGYWRLGASAEDLRAEAPPPDAPTAVEAVDARRHLFNHRTMDHYRRTLTDGIERVASRIVHTERPFTGISPSRLSPRISTIDLERPLSGPAAALDELDDIYLRDAVYFHHPRYLAHLNCPVVIPALLGEAVLTAINSSLDTWDQSAGGTLIERHVIGWTAGRIGLGQDSDGIFTSGGTQSNFQALLLAREEACELAAKNSPIPLSKHDILPRLRILASEASHFSVKKSAKLLGLGMDAVITVETDPDRRMRPAALAREIRRCHRDDLVVMAVAATAGTTDFGSIDPLCRIADLCTRAGVWLHVDAAYGCGLLVSPTRRHLLDGIERADSVTVDYHKSFFQPVSCSAILVRDKAVLRHATYYADYLNPVRMAEQRIPNQVDKSIQTTRRFDALKVWLTLRIMGPDAVGELFDQVVDRAAEAWAMLTEDPRFEVVPKSQLSTVVFRYLPPPGPARELTDEANLHAREALAVSGEAVVAGTKVDGRHYLKFTLLNPETSLDDIAHVLDLLAEHAGRYVTERI